MRSPLSHSICILLTLAIAAASPATAQEADALVPAWQVGDHGVEIRTLPGQADRTALEASFPIGGGRSGFGRALSRLANTVGVGGFSLAVRTATNQGMPDGQVQLRIYLKDLVESMPGDVGDLQLGDMRVRLQRDGAERVYSGELREADYSGHMPIEDFVRLLGEERIDGVFEGRQFLIENNQLAALRDLVLRVAPAGTSLVSTPAAVAHGPAGETTAGHSDDGFLAQHGLHETGRSVGAVDRTSVAWLVDVGAGAPGPFLLQPVLGRWAVDDGRADWAPFAAVGDTVYLAGDRGVQRAVITDRRSVEETNPGSLCRSAQFTAQGWLYDVATVDGPLPRQAGWATFSPALSVPVAEMRRLTTERREGYQQISEQPGYEALQQRAFAAIRGHWEPAMRAARGEGGDRFENPRPTRELLVPETVQVLSVQGAGGEILLASVSLHETDHYMVPSTYFLYVIEAGGRVVQTEQGRHLPRAVARTPAGGADLLIYDVGIARWTGAGFSFPTREFEYSGCT
jgi:hypothetical protein